MGATALVGVATATVFVLTRYRYVEYGHDFELAGQGITGSPTRFGTLFVAQLIAMTGVGWFGLRRGALVVGRVMEAVLGRMGAPGTEPDQRHRGPRRGHASAVALFLASG